MIKKTDINISDAFMFFGHQDDLIGAVVYQGDLRGAVPVEAHLDTASNKLTMVFNTGRTKVEHEIMDLTETQSLMAVNEHDKFVESRKGHFNSLSKTPTVEKIGFYAINDQGEYKKDEVVNVPVLVMG